MKPTVCEILRLFFLSRKDAKTRRNTERIFNFAPLRLRGNFFPFCLCLAVLFVAGCGMKGVNSEVTPAVKKGMIEELDPFTISDEFAMIKQPQAQNPPEAPPQDSEGKGFNPLFQNRSVRKPAELPESRNSSPGADETPVTTDPLRQPAATMRQHGESVSATRTQAGIMGFRIHIGIFDKESEAKEFAKSTESKIDEKVYIVYEAPFFKVRVGDFTNLKEAEEYVKYLKSIGFKSSWWIRTTINTQ